MTASSEFEIPRFGREFFGADQTFTLLGGGELGGKGAGLYRVKQKVVSQLDPVEFPEFEVVVPTLTVLGTDLFDAFLAANDLEGVLAAAEPDDRIAHAFQSGVLPATHLGDLRALIAQVHTPLAVRSSSLLEDDLHHPFAGVYATKMIPNNQPVVASRFQKFVEAIKFVYASTFFRQARSYLHTVERSAQDEKMAVVVQEIVGQRFGDRYYPGLSGVARSYNYYPSGHAAPEEGVVNLALGLGKQIVDGGLCWTYCPAYPQAPPPYNNVGDLLKNSQTEFWAVNMGKPPPPDPIRETEYMLRLPLEAAEQDGALAHQVSSYDPRSDRLRPGLAASGPRVLDFAPLLAMEMLPLNRLIRRLLGLAEQAVGGAVEIEFAVTLNPRHDERRRFGFLQMRPMMVSNREVAVDPQEMSAPNVLLASEAALGNGSRLDIQDVVFVKPETFEAKFTRSIAAELERINWPLAEAGRPYLLIGFGRWGSSDPWLGIPVEWGQVSGARVIVESSLPGMNPDLSQGSHFFHNLISFQVLYLSTKHQSRYPVDWEWLHRQQTVSEATYVKHVRTAAPLAIKVDGRHGRGVIQHGNG
jgi:hypothetical protein